jgi:subtilisin family serine protease
MQPRSIAIVCLALLLALPAGGSALAQSRSAISRGGQDGGFGGRAGGDTGGHRGGGRFGGFGGVVPGLLMTLPQAEPEPVVEDDEPIVRRTQRPQRRQSTARRGASGAPPAGERRYVPDEVVLELRNTVPERQIRALQRRFRLTQLERERLQLSGTSFFRWRIPDRRSVPAVVRALEADRLVVSAQPNYTYALQETATAAPSEGDPAQYELAKLHLPEAHALAKGDGIRVAVIDSGVDAEHPDLAGVVAESFNAAASPPQPHAHGTAVAALIAAHGRLMGAAPQARILAVRAFDPKGGSAQGTSFAILKGIDWAAAHGARVINMSFAGPPDPAAHRALEAAHKKGIVLIAAAGNAGPKSPPLYPAADPEVIAVTATDAHDGLLPVANRGRHIAVAAPGVDLLVAIPNGGYEVSSGTSYSAAEVSGIAALLLQHKPALTPDKLRGVLLATAKDLGPIGRDDQFGAGLADGYAALVAGEETAAHKRR